ncbi:2-oxoacid:acceptor oxidoreductase family protein [Methanosarcina horonobensis]|uniref:2-oxoacid:acceptor oxidoreductase family protein n=1 Tax=Methanosarcina horonobensis TaxID=418008 RepID=UPI000AFE89A5|nr:2-oxoacid:acceptor oxidoreductase family protein [Methanosarcina horonobensis]
MICLDFTRLAEEVGTYRAANVAMLGAAAGMDILPFSRETIMAVLETEIPEKHRAVNRAVFEGAIEKNQVNLRAPEWGTEGEIKCMKHPWSLSSTRMSSSTIPNSRKKTPL